MKNNFQFNRNPCWLFIPVIMLWVFSCQKAPEPATVLQPESQATSKASLVSVQAMGNQTAELVVKASPTLKATDWQLTSQANDGKAVNLESGETKSLTTFTLNAIRASGLAVGQTYRFRLRFLYNRRDTLTVERVYKHTTPANWRRLAHIDADAGDFTGSILPPPGLDRSFLEGNAIRLSVVRYVTDEAWQAREYRADQDQWFGSSLLSESPRHSLVRFRLQAVPGVTYTFFGLGFTVNSLRPEQRVYPNTMTVRDDQKGEESKLKPDYAGEDGEVALFTTKTQAFFLTQQGSPALWIRNGDWSQQRGRDFPEAPGTLATFTVNEIGYVVNQREGQPTHLFSYNPATDQWSRRADFPGPGRSRGVGFSTGGRGYFGAGITGEEERGLRDLWQYDPATDKWQYVTDYPGQGNRYLITYSTAMKAYLGWGYESQPSPSGGTRVVGCTDFWEFVP